MPWHSAEVLFDRAEEELKIWNRADVDRDLGSENRSHGATSAIATRNRAIRAQHDNGATLSDLMEAYDLSQRQVLRVLSQRRR